LCRLLLAQRLLPCADYLEGYCLPEGNSLPDSRHKAIAFAPADNKQLVINNKDKMKDLYQKYFPNFQQVQITTTSTTINALVGGEGPPLLLLHGYPQNLLMWRKVAPSLAANFTVIVSDLRGYGKSGKPDTDEQHLPYSKRVMAQDQVDLMLALGHQTFMLAGHDRGARVAHRLALDHAKRITKLIILDILPTLQLYRETDMSFATQYWHWFFLIQPYPLPEMLLGKNVDFMAQAIFAKLVKSGAVTTDVLAAYKKNFSNPKALRASCEDYRAGATIDLLHDEADIDKKILCPTLVLWGAQNLVYQKKEMIKEWQKKAVQVTGQSMNSGHFITEEVPEDTISIFEEFLKNK